MVDGDNALHLDTQPSVILVIGVNGVGKTTTIGKLRIPPEKGGQERDPGRGGYVPRGGDRAA